jgi:RNA polymerase sigma-70 factor, ECF subfamily
MNSCTAQIWEQHSDKLKSFICNKVNGDDSCHDILQDVFLKISENAERIKWVEQPASYVIKMAQNAVIDYYRLKRKTAQLPETDSSDEEGQQSDIKLADCCLLSFIKALPPIYSEPLMLVELEGLSQKQLAQKLKISYTGAKSRIQRGRKMLKAAILACCPYQFDKYGNIIGCCK